MGRKSLTGKHDGNSRIMQFRITEHERELVEIAAARAGMTTSEFIRSKILPFKKYRKPIYRKGN